MSEIKPVTVHIMGNEYHVSSPEDQVEALEEAARNLDKRMREIKAGGRIVGTERIAVMAALNLTYEVQTGDPSSSQAIEDANQRVQALTNKIDTVLAENAQLEL
ncbi:cell division protein ZapA [Aliikangiella sp. IMCC44653]